MSPVAANLLVELFTEELPPKALQRLGASFAESLTAGLAARGLLDPGSRTAAFATPRRLAAHVSAVRSQAPDKSFEEKLMPVSVALGATGEPTPALLKRLAAKGFAPDPAKLHRAHDGKNEVVVYRDVAPGQPLDRGLGEALNEAIVRLPIPKVMSYQRSDGSTVHFVRPAHGLVALHGERTVEVTALGLLADRFTRGHRFQGAASIALSHADEYETRLETEGHVIASFERRRAMVERLLVETAAAQGADLRLAERSDLLDEVTALVEHPSVYVARFDAEFLAVPQECLILTMQQNQKYFPLFDRSGKLVNRFLIVSNLQLGDASRVISGNERVVRPRLSDARFFFETDKKTPLAQRVPLLASIVYHNKLGSVGERTGRVAALAGKIAGLTGSDRGAAELAATLSKADLVTGMVGEFPELQGLMGRYYALHDGEPAEIGDAIAEHYRPRFAGDLLPSSATGQAVAIADKLDSLTGIFGIGQVPTGDKDPFGLRRAALGVLRILAEAKLPLDLGSLIAEAIDGFPGACLAAGTHGEVHAFMIDRLRGYLREAGFTHDETEAVLADMPTRIDQVVPRAQAVKTFRALPEAGALAAANKRIGNILRKADGTHAHAIDPALLAEEAERALHAALIATEPRVASAVAAGDYGAALMALAGLRGDVDRFFDQVLVNAEDPKVRANRFALLGRLQGLLNAVADIGRLAG